MATKIKPAFPGRTNAMGYETGISKLEWITTQLLGGAAFNNLIDEDEVIDAVDAAKRIIEACAKAESND